MLLMPPPMAALASYAMPTPSICRNIADDAAYFRRRIFIMLLP